MQLDVFISIVCVLFVGVPLLTLLHELGHALAAAVLVGGRVTVLQGPEPRRIELSLWRLDLRLHGPVLPHRAWIGWARWQGQGSYRRHAAALAGGPAASMLGASACAAAALETNGAVALGFAVLAVDAGCQFLSSGLPVRYPSFAGAYAGDGSDGWKIWNLLHGRNPWRARLSAPAAPADRHPPVPPAQDHVGGASPAAAGAGPGPAAARS